MRHVPFAGRLTVLLVALVALVGCDTITAEEHLARAESRIDAGNYSAAVIELRNSLQKSPDLVDARQRLGQLHVMLGQYEEGLAELERAYDLGAERDAVLPDILHAKVRLGRHQEVLGELHDAEGVDARMEVIRGDALLAAGDPAAAAEAYERALADEPDNVGAILGLGRVNWQLGEPDRAAAHFAQVKTHPNATMEAMLTIGEFEISQGRNADARETFQRATELPGINALPLLGVARTHINEQQIDEARAVVERVLEANSTLPAANYLMGLVQYQQQDYDGAETSLRRVHQYAPDHPQTTLLLGVIKVHQRQFSQAQDLLQRYLAIDRTNVTARKMLAAIHLEEGNPQRAVDVLRSQPEELMDAQAWSLLGTANLRIGNMQQATRAFQAAVDSGPATGTDPAADLRADPQLEHGRTENQVMLIVSLLRDNRFEDARDAAQRFIDEQPDSPLGFNFLGAAHIGLGDVDGAEQAFERALALDPGYDPAATNLAQLELQRNNPDGAAARYRALIERDPGSLAGHLGLAQLALMQNDAATAEQHLTEAAHANPNAAQPRVLMAQLAYSTNDRDRARQLVDEVLALEQDHMFGLLMRARLDLDANDQERAGRTVDQLQRRVQNVSNAPPDLLFRLAQMQLQLDRRDMARANLNQVIAANPRHTDALTVLAQLEIGQRNWTPARRLIEQVRAAAPDRPLHLVVEGDLHRARGELGPAADKYRQAISQGSRDAVFRLVGLHQSTGETAQAVAVLDRYVQENPDDLAARFTIAGTLIEEYRLDDARTHYEHLYERVPQNAIVLNNLAWIYHQQGDDRARDLAERAHALAPQSAAIMDTLGVILLDEGEVDRARELLRQAAAASGDNPTIRFHLATAHQRAGAVTEARDLLQDLLGSEDEFPERDSARALLAELE